MKIQFTVGEREKHVVDFCWGQFLGTSSVSVDGKIALRGKPKALEEVATMALPWKRYKYLYDVVVKGDFGIKRLTTWDVDVGSSERHEISIVKERPIILAGLRPHKFRVLVDGQLLIEKTGY